MPGSCPVHSKCRYSTANKGGRNKLGQCHLILLHMHETHFFTPLRVLSVWMARLQATTYAEAMAMVPTSGSCILKVAGGALRLKIALIALSLGWAPRILNIGRKLKHTQVCSQTARMRTQTFITGITWPSSTAMEGPLRVTGESVCNTRFYD